MGEVLVDVEHAADASLQDGEVHTDVDGVRGLPADGLVGEGVGGVIEGIGLVTEGGRIAGQRVFGGVGLNAVVAGASPTCAEFELVDPADVHPGFLIDTPTEGDGGEEGPLVADTQHGGAVVTDGGRDHVAVLVGVVDTAHVGGHLLLAERVELRLAERGIGASLESPPFLDHTLADGREGNFFSFHAI